MINKINIDGVDHDIVGKELTKITYAELKDLRDNNQLKEGHFYRIIDYSGPIDGAGHSFDIIIQALSSNILSENAKAILNDDNDYFNNNNLNAWQLKYCLDIDDKRFDSPCFIFSGIMLDDPENGELLYFSEISSKHYTPYWEYTTDPSTNEPTITLYEEFEGMKDTSDKYFYRGVVTVDGIEYDCWLKWESSNILGDNLDGFDYVGSFSFEANYVYYLSTRVVFDNKVIFPIAHGVIYYMKDEFDNEAWYDFKNTLFNSKYTFSYLTEDLNILDYSLSSNCRNNIIHMSTTTSTPKIILLIIDEGKIYNNIFLLDCTNIELTSYSILNNSFKTKCHDIILYAGNAINNNTFDRNCYNIISDLKLHNYEDFSNNTFGCSCCNITLTGEIFENIFGHNCLDIQLNNSSYGNIFGNDCRSITLGDGNAYNVFKDSCHEIQFGNENSSNICGTFCWNINLGNNNKNIRFESSCENIILPYNYLYNIQFKRGCNNITFSQVTSTKNSPLKNIIIGPSICDEEVHFESGVDAECILTKNSNGDTVLFYLADLVQ